MDKIKELIKNGEDIDCEFTTHRGDNRTNMDEKGFSVGDEEHSKENSALMCSILEDLSDDGFNLFCLHWKFKRKMDVSDIFKFTMGNFRANSIMMNQSLIVSSGYMLGISTNLDGSQYGSESYEITIPKPDSVFECVKGKRNDPFHLYKGTVNGNPVCFTVINFGSDYEVDFFTEIPADWVSKKK